MRDRSLSRDDTVGAVGVSSAKEADMWQPSTESDPARVRDLSQRSGAGIVTLAAGDPRPSCSIISTASDRPGTPSFW